MANEGAENTNGSQFFFTLRGEDLEHLDPHHTIFGEVAEGLEVGNRVPVPAAAAATAATTTTTTTNSASRSASSSC